VLKRAALFKLTTRQQALAIPSQRAQTVSQLVQSQQHLELASR